MYVKRSSRCTPLKFHRWRYQATLPHPLLKPKKEEEEEEEDDDDESVSSTSAQPKIQKTLINELL